MNTLTILCSLLFLTTAQCQIDSTSTDITACTCDQTRNVCDASCCCDADCSADDLKDASCNAKETQGVDSTLWTSNTQSSCFKGIPMYRSNSPYGVQIKDDHICVVHPQEKTVGEITLDRLANQTLKMKITGRISGVNDSVSLPAGTPQNLAGYRPGMPIFRRLLPLTDLLATFYTLPIRQFNSETCSGSQTITYMNDFASTCEQPVNSETCANALDASKYIGQFCLIQSPTNLTGNSTSGPCCNATGTNTVVGTGGCTNALKTLTLTIFYTNPTGIVQCNVSVTTETTATYNTVLKQTFNVQFVPSGSSATRVGRSGNPGYFQGAAIKAATRSASSLIETPFTILQAAPNGDCGGGSASPVLFGQDTQSVCLLNPGTCRTATNLLTTFTSLNAANLYFGVYGNSETNTDNQWIQVFVCTSEIGSSTAPVCRTGSVPDQTGQCYVRLDIQIAYANIGAVTNPQPALGAVVFHFQSLPSSTITASTSNVLITQTVTFQDISNSPVTEGDQIPRPNNRILGDFFYPFSINHGAVSIQFSSWYYLLISVVLSLL